MMVAIGHAPANIRPTGQIYPLRCDLRELFGVEAENRIKFPEKPNDAEDDYVAASVAVAEAGSVSEAAG